MVTASHKTLKNIFDSQNGIHLSIYANNDGSPLRFRKRVNSLLKSTHEHLAEVLNEKEIENLLTPIKNYAHDSNTKFQKGTTAFFLKPGFFKAIHIPSSIEEVSVTADSFHIKPLINWAQQDQDFILIGINKNGATFYKGSRTEVTKIDEALHPSDEKAEFEFMLKWLGNWIEYLTKKSNTLVFVAADKRICKSLSKHIRSKEALPTFFNTNFDEMMLNKHLKKIRSLIQLSTQTRVNKMLREFELLLKLNTAKTNIFHIAKAAVQGRITRLLVAEDFNIFGKMDKLTGGLALHPKDMDHQDDCLLDDIAQVVLKSGGEVSVVKRSEMPEGKPIIAILAENSADLIRRAHGFHKAASL